MSYETMHREAESHIAEMERDLGIRLDHLQRCYVAACLRLMWISGRNAGMNDMKAIFTTKPVVEVESDFEQARRAGKRG